MDRRGLVATGQLSRSAHKQWLTRDDAGRDAASARRRLLRLIVVGQRSWPQRVIDDRFFGEGIWWCGLGSRDGFPEDRDSVWLGPRRTVKRKVEAVGFRRQIGFRDGLFGGRHHGPAGLQGAFRSKGRQAN